ncbi:hypothetical protein LZ554_003984 [Drepanopeziza brunnea f. sp. 'monogermtubi']|nr:hypothetical protein LZ554_003984 [Drepanopeziza brunnea f. sp. 'monogermtubi']
MRGRSILREKRCPSLCAFCAHRLGQARQSSHVQRRYLQSSRPVAKPPGEIPATAQESANRGPQPGWGRPAGPGPGPSWGVKGAGLGPVAGPSWGRGGSSIPPLGAIPTPGALPQQAAGPKPDSPTPEIQNKEALSQEKRPRDPVSSEALTERWQAGQQPIPHFHKPAAPEADAAWDLDPHEKRARDMMLAREAKSQQRQVTQGYGNGPELTRGGRWVPRTEAERIEAAQREVARRKAMERHQKNKNFFGGVQKAEIAPRFRHVLGDDEQRNAETERDESNWGQLRRIKPQVQKDTVGFDFTRGRAEREEQSKYGRYTPLATGTRPARERKPDSRESSVFDEIQRAGQVQPQRQHNSGMNFKTLSETPERDAQPVIEKEFKKNWEMTEEEIEASSRPAKEKKRRGRQPAEPVYEDVPRGKGRDKIKRRGQFVRQEEDEAETEAALARAEAKAQRAREKAERKAAKRAAPTPVLLPEFISVSNLAVALRVRYEDFVWKMEELGFEDTSHDFILNAENAGLIAQEYNFEPIIDRGFSEDLRARDLPEDPTVLPQRPPVVTIMGHVDHGKTTLLDYLRKSSVAATEHGGITQHIGAFSVPMPSGKVITFLDTPGHAAFLSMRQRGANVTDIVILVVAADDSVKPQTIEAINHAKAARVPMIVAINKIDKEDSNIDRVKQDLARHGVDVEDFGGDTQVVCVSGKTGQGMPELEEAAVTLSEILDMRAETDGQAEGWVLEASIKSMGKVATVLVRRGTMRPGDFIVAGKTWARIRCLRNEAGIEIEEAGPGTPVEIDGWREQPLAGDEVLQAPDENKAKSVVEYRLEKSERDKMAEDMDAINESRKAVEEKRAREKAEAEAAAEAKKAHEDAPEKVQATGPTGPKQVYFIIKGDVSGSVEAVIDQISALGNKEVQPHVLRYGVGQLSEFDVEHAAGAKGHLINFNTDVEPNIAAMAERAKVSIINHNIIYRLVDDIKAELSKHLPPLITQRVLGEAEVAQVFEITVKGRQHKAIAGCKVRNGVISKNARVRVMRAGEKVFDGTLDSLKNVKKNVEEMKKGSECGMGFTDWFDFQVADLVQSYEQKEEKRYL